MPGEERHNAQYQRSLNEGSEQVGVTFLTKALS